MHLVYHAPRRVEQITDISGQKFSLLEGVLEKLDATYQTCKANESTYSHEKVSFSLNSQRTTSIATRS
jgi:hypothetical protein